jgi:hypothetical protein
MVSSIIRKSLAESLLGAFLTILGAVLLPSIAPAQPGSPQDAQFQFGTSFDCSRTGQNIPSLVCQTRDLQLLDLHQLQAYYTLRHTQPERQQELRNQFTARIQGLVRECSSEEVRASGSQLACVERTLRELRNFWVQQIQQTGNAAALEEARQPVAQFWNGQLALRSRGFLPAGSWIDGVFGSGTREALSRFQSERGVPVNGFLTSATAAALQGVSSANAPPPPLAAVQQIAENLNNTATASEQATQQSQQRLSQLDRQLRAGQITEAQYRSQTESMREDAQLMRQTAGQARDVRQRLQASTQQSPALVAEEAKIHQAQRRLEAAADGLEAALRRVPTANAQINPPAAPPASPVMSGPPSMPQRQLANEGITFVAVEGQRIRRSLDGSFSGQRQVKFCLDGYGASPPNDELLNLLSRIVRRERNFEAIEGRWWRIDGRPAQGESCDIVGVPPSVHAGSGVYSRAPVLITVSPTQITGERTALQRERDEAEQQSREAEERRRETEMALARQLETVIAGTASGAGFIRVGAGRSTCVLPEDQTLFLGAQRQQSVSHPDIGQLSLTSTTSLENIFQSLKAKSCVVYFGEAKSMSTLANALRRDFVEVTIVGSWLAQNAIDDIRATAETARREEERRRQEAAAESARREDERRREAAASSGAAPTPIAPTPTPITTTPQQRSASSVGISTTLHSATTEIAKWCRLVFEFRNHTGRNITSARSAITARNIVDRIIGTSEFTANFSGRDNSSVTHLISLPCNEIASVDSTISRVSVDENFVRDASLNVEVNRGARVSLVGEIAMAGAAAQPTASNSSGAPSQQRERPADVTSLEGARAFIAGKTFEWRDETGVRMGIPVGVTQMTLNSDATQCIVRGRMITQNNWDEARTGASSLSSGRYIDTGAPFVRVECSLIGFSVIVQPNGLSVGNRTVRWLARIID